MSGDAIDPGCFGVMLSCFLGDDNATTVGQSSHETSATVPPSNETNTCTAGASLAGDSDFDRSMPHSSSSPLANIEDLEGEDGVGPFDEGEERSAGSSKLGEGSLVAGLEETIQKVMDGHNEDGGSNRVPVVDAVQNNDQQCQRRQVTPTKKSKSKKMGIGTTSSLIRSLSSRRQSRRRRQSNDKTMSAADGSNGNIDDVGKKEVDKQEQETVIDALVPEDEQEEPSSTIKGAKSLDRRERSADNRFVIEYVKSEDNGDEGLEAVGYNAHDEGIFVPTGDVSAFSDRTSSPDSPLNDDEDEENFAEVCPPIEVVLEESDDESVPGPPKVTDEENSTEAFPPIEVVLEESDDESVSAPLKITDERSIETKEEGSRGKARSKISSTLKRSVGSLRRVGSRGTRSKKAESSITQDLNTTLQLDDTLPTSPDVSTATYRNSISDREYTLTKIYVDGVDDDDISDDSSSVDETSSEKLRRRVVDVETRVQSQISQAKSFDSQQSQHALVHRSTSGHRGGIRSSGDHGETVPKSEVIVDLGGHDGIITGGGYLETSDEVKKFKGMPLFVEQGIYDAVIPARSADEKSVVFIEAPATDPISSGLVTPYGSGSDEEDGIDENYLEEEGGEQRKKSSKGRPLAFLRKKQRDTCETDCK